MRPCEGTECLQQSSFAQKIHQHIPTYMIKHFPNTSLRDFKLYMYRGTDVSISITASSPEHQRHTKNKNKKIKGSSNFKSEQDI